jgi:hypothetical protein
MPVINVLGTKLYIRVKPTFPGAKAPVLVKVPYTAERPTKDQEAQRKALAKAAYDAFGTTGKTSYKGKTIPTVAAKVAAAVKKPEAAKVSAKHREEKRKERHELTAKIWGF